MLNFRSKRKREENENGIDEWDDSDDDMYDDNDEEITNLDDANHLTSLFNSMPSSGSQIENDSSHMIIRSAFGVSDQLAVASSSIFGDSIRSYIEAPLLFQLKENQSPYYLSIDRNVNQTDLIGSEKMYIGNINYSATSNELKQFLINLGYKVIRVELPRSPHRVNSYPFFV
jgi:hypothetical protein